MRIIAGEFKGRKLFTPTDECIRPTADKVKEAIFSMVGDHLNGAVVIDLFSGSGALGLEALSRGAKVCYFCDNSAAGIRLTKDNIKLCGAESRSKVIPGDFKRALSRIPEKADIILLDPPYAKDVFEACFEGIQKHDLLNESGVVVAEHGNADVMADNVLCYVKIKEKKYGVVRISLYVELNDGVC